MLNLNDVTNMLRQIPVHTRYGRVTASRGNMIEVAGLDGAARTGSHLSIMTPDGPFQVEVVGFDRGQAQCMSFSDTQGVSIGMYAELQTSKFELRPSALWLGRVINGLGEPVDGKGPIAQGREPRAIKSVPPPAANRARVGARMQTGVRVLDLFVPLCEGQRLGLFAGSGVGKSVMLSMLARWCDCDVAVIGLIGERGREVQEFIEDDLGPEGLARSVVVVATSDESALLRRQAAWTTLAVAEHFRDEGKRVLCLMDSVTRFAMAQREIGLGAGEPPATKGYTPTVFAELPRLLERAGPGLPGQGSITGVFTVLVDGDDHNEPVADAVRGILDGHVVMSRRIAERGRYPAVDVLKSVSRTLPQAQTDEENAIRLKACETLSLFGDMEEIVRLGAYRSGANPQVDRAILLAPQIEQLRGQGKDDPGTIDEAFQALAAIEGVNDGNSL